MIVVTWHLGGVNCLGLKAEVNFINILCGPFSYKSTLCGFSLIIVWLNCNFFRKNICTKAARKMMMKLTSGGQFNGYSKSSLVHKYNYAPPFAVWDRVKKSKV